jgi:hypothetical protein
MISAIGSDFATWHPPPPSYEMDGHGSGDIPAHWRTRSLRSAGQLATPQPRGKGHICEPDEQPELQEDRADEDAVSRSRQDSDQDAEERRQPKVDKSQSARPATQLGANRMQSVLHPRSIGATALRLKPTAGRRRLFGIGADHDSSGDIPEHWPRPIPELGSNPIYGNTNEAIRFRPGQPNEM